MTNRFDSRKSLFVRQGCLLIAAVPVTALVMVMVWFFIGGGVWRGEVRVVRAELLSPDSLTLFAHSCDGHAQLSLLRETDVDVQVKAVGFVTPFRDGPECQDVDVHNTLILQEPLGNRVIVDKRTGQTVPVSIVNPSSDPQPSGGGSAER